MERRAHLHAHDHGHAHHGRVHAFPTGEEYRLGWAFAVVLVFTLVEGAGGLVAGSLALLADAGHMLSDAAALGMSWAALRIGRRPADRHRSYGYRRLEVLVAFANGLSLFVLAGWILIEAARRLAAPLEVEGAPMLAVALVGLLANLVAFMILEGGNRANLTLKSAWLHVLSDVLGFLFTIVAAAVILSTGWTPIDPLLSLLLALLILKSAWGIVRASAHILLEGTPPGLDLRALGEDLAAAVPAVAEVHHVHAWSMTAEEPLVTLHVRCAAGADPASLLAAINRRLKERFGITHATIQLDPEACADEHHR